MNEIVVYWIVLGCLAFSAIYFHRDLFSRNGYRSSLLCCKSVEPHICFFTFDTDC